MNTHPIVSGNFATDDMEQTHDYRLVAQAIELIEQQMHRQPTLDEIAERLAISPGHLQRTFQRWAGISPKRFLQYLTVDYAKSRLDASRSILQTTFDTGLSSPGRLHDHFVRVEAMTPGEYKQKGVGLSIRHGCHETPFGPALIAVTPRGLNAVAFLDVPPRAGDSGDEVDQAATLRASYLGAVDELARQWPGAHLHEDPTATAPWLRRIFDPKPRTHAQDNAQEVAEGDAQAIVPILLKGTAFQVKVWEALLKIPEGALCAYGDIARQVCGPKAARAVGAAVGANPIAYLIPCHRVIRQSGIVHDYRWGSTRKKAILGWEAAGQDSAP